MSAVPSIRRDQVKTVLLSSLGGCLEFYDFVIFGVFAANIGHVFFPGENNLVSLMAAFAAFGVGYLARPLGGVCFAHFGDRYGRKRVFMLSIYLMAISTLLAGLLPGYSVLGILSPILFICLRMLQGAAVGGEIPGAATFIAEHMRQHRGFACGILILFINAGLLLADVVHSLLSHYVPVEYAWRIAFLLGSSLAFVSYIIRQALQESPAFAKLAKHHRIPLLELLSKHRLALLNGSSLIMLQAIGISLFYLYVISYMQVSAHYSALQISRLSIINIMIMALGCGIFGWLSDFFPPKRLLYISIIIFPMLGYWFYYALNAHLHPMLPYVLLSVFFGMYAGCALGWLTALFPVAVRFSGVAVCYNISFAIFGGLTPLLATYLIHIYHNTMLPAWLVILIAPLTLLGCIRSRAAHSS